MLRLGSRTIVTVAALVAAGWWTTDAVAGPPPLFENYYVGPARYGAPGMPAELYISPRPTPPLVGHTWVTYPPLAPHEFLYHHHRTYWRYTPNGGHTVTRVRYWSTW